MEQDAPSAPVGRRTFLRGAVGVAGVGATAGVASAQDGGDEIVVELGDYYYQVADTGQDLSDDPLRVEPGTTVRFVWITDTHNIAITSAPDDSDWEGVPDVYDAGHEHEHTFTVEGTYEFECTPHVGLGMIGTIVVTDEPVEPPVAVGPQLPEEAMTIAIGTTFALIATLGFAYVFLKYGGEAPEET